MLKRVIIALMIILCCLFLMGDKIKNPKNIQQEWKTDMKRKSINLNELTILLKRNQIEPVQKTIYISAKEALDEYYEEEPIIAVNTGENYYAYPLSVLTRHEIVNEKIGDLFYSVTYCPLCNTTIVFDRKIKYNKKTHILKFGTSGMLRKSNLVMWDEITETWWQQFNGKAIVGKLTGITLGRLPIMRISLQDFVKNFPGGKVLSKESGYKGKSDIYSKNPYAGYDNIKIKKPRLFFEKVSNRLPAMERTVGVRIKTKRKIYPFSIIKEKGVINDNVNNKDVVIFYKKGVLSILDKKQISESRDIGTAVVFNPIINDKKLSFKKTENHFIDNKTGSKWNIVGQCISGPLKGEKLKIIKHNHHFAFVTLSFYPDVEIYRNK